MLLTYCTKVYRPSIFLNRTGAADVFCEQLFDILNIFRDHVLFDQFYRENQNSETSEMP